MLTGRLVLVGAGHAHLHLVDRADLLRGAGLDVTLVAPPVFRYSGMAVAAATGAVPPEAGAIDVAALAARRGVRHLPTTATCVDAPARRVHLADGTRLDYDWCSLNVGSVLDDRGLAPRPAAPPVPAQGPRPAAGPLRTSGAAAPATAGPRVEAVPVKPLDALLRLRDEIRDLADRPQARVAVVGGGPTGLELAGNLAARLPADHRVELFDARAGRGGLPPGAARRVSRILRRRGVRLRAERVAAADGRRLRTSDGVEDYDLVILALGLAAPPLIPASGLGDHRGVPVTATLQHVDHPELFAVGDAARFLPRPLPRVGVYGVRAAPVLLAGLLACARGEAPPRFDPQRRALRILDLGGGTGLAVRGRWWIEGRGALRLKRVIDARWLARYRREDGSISDRAGFTGRGTTAEHR